MITKEAIYDATCNGLDIILMCYPEAKNCLEKEKKKFKMRTSEKTPSAMLYPPNGQYPTYSVVDFGDDGHRLSPIDVYMRYHNIPTHRFYEAILQLASIFDVRDELNSSVNKPRFEQRAAKDNEKENTRVFSFLKKIPTDHLRILGPSVTQENCDTLHWHEAEYIGYVKDRKVSLRYSTDTYPILMRECKTDEGNTFYKIYEPLNPDKGHRFTYTPAGVKPKEYINGYRELCDAIDLMNATRDEDELPVKKLREAFICSGERDALCCMSMGFHPLWFNSETYDIKPYEYTMIMEKVETLYNIPDIDETGKRRGIKLALEYLNIKTIWLPEWLMGYKDNRHKPRKDLRDWMELRDREKDFRNLMTTALSAKFWEAKEDGKSGKKDYTINSIRLFYFLQLNGFCMLRDDSESCVFIRIIGNKVMKVKPRDVRRFVREWAESHYCTETVRNMIANTMKFNEASLENLREVDLNFVSYTASSQLMFFRNMVVQADDKGLQFIRVNDFDASCYVWEENIIDHDISELDELFHISRNGDEFDIDVLNPEASCLFGYVINSSRTYWRKELEEQFDNADDAKVYFTSHHFCIDGKGLTDDEIAEQKKNLLNKIFTIGYMLHRYKSPSRPWAPYAMDDKIGELDQCNGRSGKSFLFKTLSMFMKTVTLSGRKPNLMEDPFVLGEVSQHTDMILVDDCSKRLQMGMFYDLITSDLKVNRKHMDPFSVPFSRSPKFAFTTNYVPTEFSNSSQARSLYMVFSDYYHEATEENDYIETRTIRDDFGHNLYAEDYTAAQWNGDINFILQCLRFYLSIAGESIKLQPTMKNIIYRKHQQDMGLNFEEWADSFFSPESGNLDRNIVRREVFEDYRAFSNIKNLTMQSFTVKLKAYCAICPHIHEMNPKDLLNGSNRIVSKIDNKATDMIHIRSVREAKKAKQALMEFQDENGNVIEPF